MQQGDEKFVELLLLHQPSVFRYLVMLLGSGRDAEDLFQQTCMTMWQKWHEGERPDYFRAWSKAIALNHVRNHIRKRRRGPQLMTDDLLEVIHQEHAEMEPLIDARQQALTDCLVKLPDHHRQLIREVYHDGVSMTEIAHQRRRSPDAIHKMVQRIRHSLHQCIVRSLHGEAGAL